MIPTLYYLPLRARAEPIRMVLAYGNIAYDNVLVDFPNWPDMKMDATSCPFGQLPVMKLPTGTNIAQSGAILRYVAKLAGVYPSDPERAAVADMVQELCLDMNPINPILNFFPKGSDQYNSAYDSYFATLGDRLKSLQRSLKSEKFFGGNDIPSHGDFALFHILDSTVTVKPDALNEFPTFQTWMENMKSIPQLKKYLEERPGFDQVGAPGSHIKSL